MLAPDPVKVKEFLKANPKPQVSGPMEDEEDEIDEEEAEG
jgi:hypothetical protein